MFAAGDIFSAKEFGDFFSKHQQLIENNIHGMWFLTSKES